MGRNKISIEEIKDERKRQTTFKKRKDGLLKKAMELSVLCDVEIAVVMFKKTSNQDRLYEYSSGNITQTFEHISNFEGPVESKTNANFHDKVDPHLQFIASHQPQYEQRRAAALAALSTTHRQPAFVTQYRSRHGYMYLPMTHLQQAEMKATMSEESNQSNDENDDHDDDEYDNESWDTDVGTTLKDSDQSPQTQNMSNGSSLKKNGLHFPGGSSNMTGAESAPPFSTHSHLRPDSQYLEAGKRNIEFFPNPSIQQHRHELLPDNCNVPSLESLLSPKGTIFSPVTPKPTMHENDGAIVQSDPFLMSQHNVDATQNAPAITSQAIVPQPNVLRHSLESLLHLDMSSCPEKSNPNPNPSASNEAIDHSSQPSPPSRKRGRPSDESSKRSWKNMRASLQLKIQIPTGTVPSPMNSVQRSLLSILRTPRNTAELSPLAQSGFPSTDGSVPFLTTPRPIGGKDPLETPRSPVWISPPSPVSSLFPSVGSYNVQCLQ